MSEANARAGRKAAEITKERDRGSLLNQMNHDREFKAKVRRYQQDHAEILGTYETASYRSFRKGGRNSNGLT